MDTSPRMAWPHHEPTSGERRISMWSDFYYASYGMNHYDNGPQNNEEQNEKRLAPHQLPLERDTVIPRLADSATATTTTKSVDQSEYGKTLYLSQALGGRDPPICVANQRSCILQTCPSGVTIVSAKISCRNRGFMIDKDTTKEYYPGKG